MTQPLHSVYLNTQHTAQDPRELLSLGLVSQTGEEHYVELTHDENVAVLNQAPPFTEVHALSQWGRVPGATQNRQEMSERTGQWLARQAERHGTLNLVYDDPGDFNRLRDLLRRSWCWEAIAPLLVPLDVTEFAGRLDYEMGRELAYEWLKPRGLGRHHALADAHALRAAWYGICHGRRMSYA